MFTALCRCLEKWAGRLQKQQDIDVKRHGRNTPARAVDDITHMRIIDGAATVESQYHDLDAKMVPEALYIPISLIDSIPPMQWPNQKKRWVDQMQLSCTVMLLEFNTGSKHGTLRGSGRSMPIQQLAVRLAIRSALLM